MIEDENVLVAGAGYVWETAGEIRICFVCWLKRVYHYVVCSLCDCVPFSVLVRVCCFGGLEAFGFLVEVSFDGGGLGREVFGDEIFGESGDGR